MSDSFNSKIIEHRLATLDEAQNFADIIRSNTTKVRITQYAEEHKTCQGETGKKLQSHIIENISHKFDWYVRKVWQFRCALELQCKTFKGPDNICIRQNCLLFEGQFKYDIGLSDQPSYTPVLQVC